MRKLFLSLTLSVLAFSAPAHAGKPVIGQLAPEFELTLIDKTKVKLSSLRGEVVIVNFWATWCVPCKRELPLLDAYYQIHQKHGLRVFAITTEDSVPLSQLKKLFEVMSIPSARSIKGGYDVMKGLPTNYVIDRSGRLRYAKARAFTLDQLNATIIPLLNEPRPTPVPSSD